MDVFNAIAVVLGLAGAVLGGLAWWKASEAKAIATACNRVARESTHVAAETSRMAGEVQAVAKATIQPSPRAAREVEEPEADASSDERTANIVVRSGSDTGQDLPTNQGYGSGLIGIFLVNEGPAAAHDMRLHATFPNGTRRNSEMHRTLSAHKELTLFAQVIPPDFGADDPLYVRYQISYQDGNGFQEFERDVRVEGGWTGPWRTFIEAKK